MLFSNNAVLDHSLYSQLYRASTFTAGILLGSSVNASWLSLYVSSCTVADVWCQQIEIVTDYFFIQALHIVNRTVSFGCNCPLCESSISLHKSILTTWTEGTSVVNHSDMLCGWVSTQHVQTHNFKAKHCCQPIQDHKSFIHSAANRVQNIRLRWCRNNTIWNVWLYRRHLSRCKLGYSFGALWDGVLG